MGMGGRKGGRFSLWVHRSQPPPSPGGFEPGLCQAKPSSGHPKLPLHPKAMPGRGGIKAVGTGTGSAASPQPPQASGALGGPPQLCSAAKHLSSCAREQPFTTAGAHPTGDAPGLAPAGAGGAGGCSGASRGLGPPRPAAASRFLPPSSGSSAKCGRRRRMR